MAYKQSKYNDADERLFLEDSSYYQEKWQQVNETVALKAGLLQAELS